MPNIVVLPNIINNFKDSFPCHNINDLYSIEFEFDSNSNLTDYKILQDDKKWIDGSLYSKQKNYDCDIAISCLFDLIRSMKND
jgi:hypothetical protein